MATTSTSWMPTQGRVPVKVGTSLNRALKARKQGGTPPAAAPKRLPDRDFYSFRYNFKPPAIDSSKSGTIEVKKGKEKTQVVVEHSSSQPGEVYVFAGTETQAKEWDVVLIYDDETGEYTLEKLDSAVSLTWERKRSSAARAPSPAALSPSDMDAEGENDEELEKELLDLTEDIPLAAKTKKQRPSQPPPRPPPQKKEEEEEEEEISIPPIQEPVPKPPPKAHSSTKSAARPTKPIPKPRPSAAAAAESAQPSMSNTPQPTTSSTQKATQKSKKRKEQDPPERLNEPEVEVLSFGKPTKRAKALAAAAAAQPTAPAPTSFALPGTSDSGFFQPPPAPAAAPKSHKNAHNPAAPVAAEEESEEEWEEVANADPSPRALSYHSDEGEVGDGLFGDEDGEADPEDELANQLDQELGNDFLEAAFEETPASSSTVPLSWSQLAAVSGGPGGVEDDSDDDFSSSDDSDED
ncbi:hypothetical protein NP233_g3919 [Leucocoprinus birnbaumii]|uniref:Transcription elongation factor Eaf N-terminal domain-containing protein n=1 Tax=Leucocoprinus birnbaumii TaxID=56174 RepID=A0AAD5VW59_9AGAR|nr:hypothetical protein NP233_g3919 [Leucocoprinus birnbaumii]